ncbi:MAG: hypothetical protein WC667_02650 [Sulfurimonas sp.]|jgi:hypothetical protein
MKTEKYENLESELTNLQDVLKESLQNDILQIKRLIKNSEKFKHVSDDICDLADAEYVVYSKYMTKELHDSEYYIFIDKKGNTVCRASGKELSLYNMIEDTDNLIETKKYDIYIE